MESTNLKTSNNALLGALLKKSKTNKIHEIKMESQIKDSSKTDSKELNLNPVKSENICNSNDFFDEVIFICWPPWLLYSQNY